MTKQVYDSTCVFEIFGVTKGDTTFFDEVISTLGKCYKVGHVKDVSNVFDGSGKQFSVSYKAAGSSSNDITRKLKKKIEGLPVKLNYMHPMPRMAESR